MNKPLYAIIAPSLVALTCVLLTMGCTISATTTSAPTTTTTAATATTASTAVSTSLGTNATTTTANDVSITGVTTTYAADLSGAEVVPAVQSTATGSATFTFPEALDRAYFVLRVSGITDLTASRLKYGKSGANGPGVLILYPGPTITGPYTGIIAQGWFNSLALIGPLQGKTIADLKALLESGNAYVNVGTNANPDGEIRGQVK